MEIYCNLVWFKLLIKILVITFYNDYSFRQNIKYAEPKWNYSLYAVKLNEFKSVLLKQLRPISLI